MALYVDPTGVQGCVGLIGYQGEPAVFTGVCVSAMPASLKKTEGEAYAQFARDYGIFFLFDDDVPTVDFYSVPRLDIAAVDGEGGFLAAVGGSFDLCDPVPLVYIAKDRRCYLITEDSTQFLTMAAQWREKLRPYEDVRLYPSKQDAKMDFAIEDLVQMPEYQRSLALMEEEKAKRNG